MRIGSRIYGHGFSGNKVATLARGRGFITGTTSSGKRFIFNDAHLAGVTIR